jgi:Cu2+-exporting ATPase
MVVATDSYAACLHCGTAFRRSSETADFCCPGCEFVHGLIQQNSLGQFYELQDGAIPPARSVVFQKRDYRWLEPLAAEGARGLRLDLQGLSCLGCVWLVEKLFHRYPGAHSLHVDSSIGQVVLKFHPNEFSLSAFAVELQAYGYLLGPPTGSKAPDRALPLRIGLCGALAMNAMLFTLPGYLGLESGSALAVLFQKVAFACSTLSFLTAGSYFGPRAVRCLKVGVLHIDLPIALGLAAAYAGSLFAWSQGIADFIYFDFVSVFSFLMLAGRWLQQAAVDRNRNHLLGLKVQVAEPRAGERFRVEPGALVPVRSQLSSSGATLGMEWINGESESHTVRLGQVVPAGAINLSPTPIDCEALEAWEDSMLRRLLNPPSRPASELQTGMERFIRRYLITVLVLAGAAFGAWFWGTGSMLQALQVLTSILVVSCPCAAGVALPLAEDLAAARLRRRGVFLREPTLWARLERVKTVVFDKTGTLTLETMALRNPDTLHTLPPDAQALLLAMVRDNLHPVSCALRELLLAAGVVSGPRYSPVEEIGYGLELQIDQTRWRLGKPGWAGPDLGNGDTQFSANHTVLAAFQFGEQPRPDARQELQNLRNYGLQIQILSGDRPEKVAALGTRLGIEPSAFLGALTPDAKADWIRTHSPQQALMIGDGANDSLAFDQSLCTGTPAIDRGLLEQKADFYFLGRGLLGIRELFETARHRQRAIRAVLGFALVYNVVAGGICLIGKMSPLLAAILMPLSSVATIGLALFFLRRTEAVR